MNSAPAALAKGLWHYICYKCGYKFGGCGMAVGELADFGTSALAGALFGVVMSRFGRSSERLSKELDKVLDSADLTVDGTSRALLERHAARRSRWGAIGLVVGSAFGLAVATSWPGERLGDESFVLVVPIMFLGVWLGSALSARRRRTVRPEQTRLTTLQPHGGRDYLRGREIVIETVLGVAGATAAIFGAVLLATDSADPAGWVAIVLGVLVGGASVAALVLQRWLLSSPMPADSEAQLVVNDIVLATGLRDLVNAAGSTATFAAYFYLLWLNVPWWQVVIGLVILWGVPWLVLDHRLRPDLTPVAHRIAARSAVR